jgi:hypothetical protein
MGQNGKFPALAFVDELVNDRTINLAKLFCLSMSLHYLDMCGPGGCLNYNSCMGCSPAPIMLESIHNIP